MTVSTSTTQRHNCSLCPRTTEWFCLLPPCTAKTCDAAARSDRRLRARIATRTPAPSTEHAPALGRALLDGVIAAGRRGTVHYYAHEDYALIHHDGPNSPLRVPYSRLRANTPAETREQVCAALGGQP